MESRGYLRKVLWRMVSTACRIGGPITQTAGMEMGPRSHTQGKYRCPSARRRAVIPQQVRNEDRRDVSRMFFI
jgi:hypothetical protein